MSSSLGGTGRVLLHPRGTVWRRGRNRSTCFTPSPSSTDAYSGHLTLRSYQRQASSLRRWLELSREEPRPEDQEAEQQVQEELQEVRSRAILGWVLAVPPLSTSLPARRWSCRPSSWPRSSRPGASQSAPALPVCRPSGGHCARAPAQGGLSPPPGTECEVKMSCFNYFKMLQLHESLFRSLPLFIQKYCATDTVEKFKWLLLQEKCRVPRRREPWAISVAPQGHMPCLPPSAPGLLCLPHTPPNQQQQLPLFMEGWILGRDSVLPRPVWP